MNKYYISAQSLLESSFRLAHQVFEDGFRPQFIIGIWRGGAPVGIAVQEYFEYRGVSTDHISVRTSSYFGINQQAKQVDIFGLDYLLDNICADDALLIVDDVFDSGRSVDALINEINKQARLKAPRDIRVACSWYKPAMRKVKMKPEYYVHENDDWLVFPHELNGLSREEIVKGKPDLKNILDLF